MYSILTAPSLQFPPGNINSLTFKVKTGYKIQNFPET